LIIANETFPMMSDLSAPRPSGGTLRRVSAVEKVDDFAPMQLALLLFKKILPRQPPNDPDEQKSLVLVLRFPISHFFTLPISPSLFLSILLSLLHA
jgi:hypothetical protein